MGFLFILCGPSGVGKTTFLNKLNELDKNIKIIPRYTDRPKRSREIDGFEYYFINHEQMLQKVYASDFIHMEKWGDYYSGIDRHLVDETINSNEIGILLASVNGAARIQATYSVRVSIIYMWTGNYHSLMNPRCLSMDFEQIQELIWRIRKKKSENGFSEYELCSLDEIKFVEQRMIDNFLDIASVAGRLRNNENITVLENPHNQIEKTIEKILKIKEKISMLSSVYQNNQMGGCFVLMPFDKKLFPIYNDHVKKVCENMNISVTRADQIFSNRPIIDDILESVAAARIIIADLTDDNPNVFYEIGVCHTLGKEVILITQNNEVPFDLSHIRHITYAYTPPGMEKFSDELKETISNVLEKAK